MRIVPRLALVVVVALVAGCSTAEPGEACASGRPETIVDCPRGGLSFADCGGSAQSPVFACYVGTCRWFVGGCAPNGWKASACDASNLCCADGGPWARTGSADPAVYAYTRGWGTSPWDDVREMNLDVAVGAVPATETFTCTGFPAPTVAGPTTPCDPRVRAVDLANQGLLTVHFRVTAAVFGGWTLAVEAVRDAGGVLHARACRIGFSDLSAADQCAPGAPLCASSGTLTVDAWPATHVSLHAVFDDATAIDATY